MKHGAHQLFGSVYEKGQGSWKQKKALLQQTYIAPALQYVANNILCIECTIAVRAGDGIRRIPSSPGADRYYLCTWLPGGFDKMEIIDSPNEAAMSSKLYESIWPDLLY